MRSIMRAAAVWSLVFVGWLSLVVLLDRHLVYGLHYPTVTDQDVYLYAGRQFVEQGLFLWRAPVYSAWVGLCYLLGGQSLESCLYVEKFASLALLATATSALAFRVFNWQAAAFVGLWTISCKYLVIEPNGSHTFAAFLLVLGLLCVASFKKSVGVPAALFCLFLSSQARSEMLVVLLAVVAFLVYKAIRSSKSLRTDFSMQNVRRAGTGYAVATGLVVALVLLFQVRSSPPEPGRFAEAFRENFVVNYVERNGLGAQHLDTWAEARGIWERVIPETDSPVRALYYHPGEILRHVLYNFRLFVVAVPAMVFGLTRPWLMLCAFLLLLLSRVTALRRGPAPGGVAAGAAVSARRLLVPWALAVFMVVPISLVLRVAARYYVPLIPVVEFIFLFALFSAGAVKRRARGGVELRSAA